MKLRRYGTVFLVGVGLAVCAGLAIAQPPAREGRPGARAAPPGRAGAGRPGLELLFALEDVEVEVTATDDGVEVAIATDKPELVQRLQTRAEGGVKRLHQFVAAIREGRPPEGPPPVRSGLILRLLHSGDIDISATKTDSGVVLSFTSEKPRVVQRLQQTVQEWVSQSRGRREELAQPARRWAQTREALDLLASDKVQVRIRETKKGIAVHISSDDPKVAERIKEKMPAYYEGQKEMAKRMLQRGQRPLQEPGVGGPAAPPAWGGQGRRWQQGPARRRPVPPPPPQQ